MSGWGSGGARCGPGARCGEAVPAGVPRGLAAPPARPGAGGAPRPELSPPATGGTSPALRWSGEIAAGGLRQTAGGEKRRTPLVPPAFLPRLSAAPLSALRVPPATPPSSPSPLNSRAFYGGAGGSKQKKKKKGESERGGCGGVGKKIGTGGPRRSAPRRAPSGGDGPGERSVVPARCRERCQRSGGPRQGKRHRSAPRLPPQSRKAAPPPRLQHSRLQPRAGQGRAGHLRRVAAPGRDGAKLRERVWASRGAHSLPSRSSPVVGRSAAFPFEKPDLSTPPPRCFFFFF